MSFTSSQVKQGKKRTNDNDNNDTREQTPILTDAVISTHLSSFKCRAKHSSENTAGWTPAKAKKTLPGAWYRTHPVRENNERAVASAQRTQRTKQANKNRAFSATAKQAKGGQIHQPRDILTLPVVSRYAATGPDTFLLILVISQYKHVKLGRKAH